MAVSKHIVDLTRLALMDRELTYRERQTIMIEARAEGIPDAEINAFLDNMYAQRLKSFSKEELKDCPACGAQIPLISDQCLFCGHMLEHQEGSSVKPISVTGCAADIIREENLKTTQEELNRTNCPNCGAPFPLLSNICPHCGHVLHAQKESDLNIKTLIDNINGTIKALSNAPKPTFIDVLKFHRGVLMLFVGIVLFVSAFSFSDLTAGCMLVLGLPLGIFGVRWQLSLYTNGRSELESPVTIADEVYYTALNHHNKYVRLAKSIYGDNPEATKYLATLDSELKKAEKVRKSNRLTLTIVIVLIALIGLLPLAFLPSAESYYEDVLNDNFTIFETNQTIDQDYEYQDE